MRSPKYCLHKASGQAYVRMPIPGTSPRQYNTEYLGEYDSERSRREYHRLVAEYLAGGGSIALPPPDQQRCCTVEKLLLLFWTYAQKRYVKNGKPTSEINSYRTALRPVRELYGLIAADQFGPRALAACKDKLIAQGFTRKRVNGHLSRIRRCWKWGTSQELVPVAIFHALQTVEGVRKGEEGVVETEKIKPAPEDDVFAVKPFASPTLWSMIEFQWWTGCRPGEVAILRPCDLVTDSNVWIYVPESHKTEHHDRDRLIFIGPRGQDVLKRWLPASDPEACMFSPAESKEWYLTQRRKNRRSPMTPSQRKRKRKKKPKKSPRSQFDTSSYGQAIARLCKQSGVLHWAPNQLRHSRSTKIRELYDLDAARAICGHASMSTTEIYAERDYEKCREIMSQIG